MRTIIVAGTVASLFSLLLLGCSTSPDTSIDGGDGGADGGDLGLDGGDLSAQPATLCTTTACAQSPCTAGCIFTPDCSGSLAASAATATVEACSSFCGLFTNPNGLGCGIYNGSHPGCMACGPAWGAPSCVDVSPMIDYKTGGAICNGTTCFDGRAPPDASVPCDMLPQG